MKSVINSTIHSIEYVFLHCCSSPSAQLTFCETIWVIRDHYIGSAFFDASAAAFIMPSLLARVTGEPVADDDLCESKFDRSPTTHQATNSLNGEPCTDSRGMSPAYGLGPERTDSRGRSPAYGLGPEWLARKSLKCRISELEQQREQLLPRQNMQDQSQELPRHKQSICPLKVSVPENYHHLTTTKFKAL